MKFYTEEITVLKDGTSAHAIDEKESENEAISAFHMVLASAIINESVMSCHAEAKNSVGGIYETKTYTAKNTTINNGGEENEGETQQTD